MPKETTAINVEGMSCSHCVNSVKESVGALNGVDSVMVDLAAKRVIVEYDPDKVSLDTIKGIIEDQGYIVK